MAVGLTPSSLGQMQATSDPFVWGKGGRRLTPEQIEQERQIAASLAQPDYSPLQHWTQGLARLSGNLLGAWRGKEADKAAQINATDSQRIAQLLLGGQTAPGTPPMSPAGEVPAAGGAPMSGVAEALSSPYVDDATRQLAAMVYKQQHREPPAPHYWKTNNGSLGMIGPDGKPVIVYQDPTDKLQWIQADLADGSKQLIPVGPNGPIMGGGGPASTAPGGAPAPQPAPPGVTFTPLDDGGPTPSASGGFPRPSR